MATGSERKGREGSERLAPDMTTFDTSLEKTKEALVCYQV